MKKSPVEYIRPEVEARLEQWARIRAAIDGEEAVKALCDKILPRPNPTDVTAENQARYNAYLGRAVFYNVSGRTLNGLTGYVFAKEPVVTLPATLQSLETNVDGSGVTLNQQAKATLMRARAFGRGGLLVDYPSTVEATTRQQLIDGNVAPTIVLYEPEQITNWDHVVIGAKSFLKMLVLKESYTVPGEDEFERNWAVQYRVLTLEDGGGVLGRIFRRPKAEVDYEPVKELEYRPQGQTGVRLKTIPFTFVGSSNNDPAVDTPPMLDLVNLNLAHFRNSADYEESCYIVGQPTPYVSGLTKAWVDEVMNGTMQLGSRGIIPLPVGGAAGLLQATPNSMPFEAMEHKEKQMVALGAKLVEQKEVQQTATEANLNNASEVSTLTAAATNVFLAYKAAFDFCGQFVGADTAAIDFDLTEPLSQAAVTPEQATAIMAAWQGNLIDFEEARWQLKKSGWAWKEDDEVRANNEAEGFNQPPEPVPVSGGTLVE